MRTNSAMTRVDIYSWFSNAMDGNNLLVFLFLLIIGGIYSVRKHELKKKQKTNKEYDTAAVTQQQHSNEPDITSYKNNMLVDRVFLD